MCYNFFRSSSVLILSGALSGALCKQYKNIMHVRVIQSNENLFTIIETLQSATC